MKLNRTKAKPLSKKEEARVNKKFESFKNKEYSEDFMNDVFEKEDAINKKMSNDKLKEFASDVKLFFCMLKDFFTRKYTNVPVGTIMTIAGSLLYVFLPVDIMPDFIPGIGYLDDGAMIALCLKMLNSDLTKYKEWKETQV
jgi:uncharacterized membrane protein YkvA (DUF1232 family)